jgi:glycerol uptake facilitator-like aquaporin
MTSSNGTAEIFFTVPRIALSHWNTFIDQVVFTSLLMIYIMAITHVK